MIWKKCSIESEIKVASNPRLRTVLPDGERATMLMVSGQGVLVYALTQDQELVDSLRQGQQIQLVMWPQSMLDETVLGVLSGLQDQGETRALVCPVGNRYEPNTGFRFCPQCGSRLRAQD